MVWSGNGKALEDRAAFWREHLAAHEASGLSVRVYCREHGLGEASFYQWRRRFQCEEAEAPASGRPLGNAGLVRGALGQPRPAFAEVRLAPLDAAGVASASGVEVVLGGERRLRLEAGFDAETLRRAVAALESLPC